MDDLFLYAEYEFLCEELAQKVGAENAKIILANIKRIVELEEKIELLDELTDEQDNVGYTPDE